MRKFIYGQQARTIIKINILFWGLSCLFNGLTAVSDLGDENHFKWLLFSPTFDQAIHKPWSIFTYTLLHKNWFHLLVNLVGLGIISNMICKLISAKHILKVYVAGSIGASLFYGLITWLYANVFQQGLMQTEDLLGMTPAVYALWTYVLGQYPRARWEIAEFFSISAMPIFWIWMVAEFGWWYLTSDGTRMASFGGAITGYLISSYQGAFSDAWHRARKWILDNMPFGVTIRP